MYILSTEAPSPPQITEQATVMEIGKLTRVSLVQYSQLIQYRVQIQMPVSAVLQFY